MKTQSVDVCRHRQSTSVTKMSNRCERNGRNKSLAGLDQTLKKSFSETHVRTHLDKEVAGNMLDKVRSIGNLKRNTSFRKSFACRLKSLPSFRRKILFKYSETESLGLDGINEMTAGDANSMHICLDKIGLKSQKRKRFRKNIFQKFRTKKGTDIRKYCKIDNLINKGTTCSDVNDSELTTRTRNPHKYSTMNITLKLTSRLTATSEQVDFTGLITPVAFHPGKGTASTKSYGQWSRGIKNTSDCDAILQQHAETSELRVSHQPNELKKVEGTYKSENGDDKDKSDIIDAKANNGYVFKDNGSVVIAECSNKKPTSDIMSPTCADIYGQDEGVDVSFNFPYEHSFSQVQALSHGRLSSQAKIGMMQLEKNAIDKSADLRLRSSNEKSAIKSDFRAEKGNVKDNRVDVDKDLMVTKKINDTSAKVDTNETNVNYDELKSVVKRSSATLIERSVQSIDKDNPFLSDDVKSVSNKRSEGYDEVDNPWVLRTDLFEHTEKKQREPHSKSRSFISEYSVDDSMGFSVNQWTENEHKSSKRKHSTENAEDCNIGQMNRSNSIESVDSFSSSIHSAHSEDLFFSASEPEMDPDQISVSSSGSSPSDKPMGLLKIDEAEEQVSPALVKLADACRKKRKGDTDELMVKSLNDLNAAENIVSSSSSTPRRISSYLSGLRSLSFESSGKNKSKTEKQNQRRSLDSNLKIQQMSLDLNMNESPAVKSKLTNSSDSCTLSPDEQLKHSKPSKKSRRHTLDDPEGIGSSEHHSMKTKFKSSESVLKSPLSPVVERTHKSPKKVRRRTVDVTPDEESRKFFTMPARRKPKADQQESPRRRVTRIASISKVFSDKAHSLSNIRLGSSFKLRNTDGEKNKLPSFLKTASLTNLMAKKGAEMASSLSTLIRGRSNSNTVVNSPFKQKEKPKVSNDNEMKNELHYEKVKILCKRNRPVTCGEFTAWKRRLTLNLELANTLTAEETMRLRADSFARRSHGSGSENGSTVVIRSPTLLDEIMKSVDNTRFRSLGSACDIDDTDDEDSSNEGTINYVFKKRMNDSATSIRSALDHPVSVCNKCGYLVSMDTSSKQIEYVLDSKMSHSLCDLRKKCKCLDFQSKCLKASKLKPKRSSLISENESEINSPLSSEFSESTSSGSPQLIVSSSHHRRSSHFLSMFELRESEREQEATESHSKASLEMKDSSQGSLPQHKPMLDLSADQLDVTDETDSGVVMYEKDRNSSRERRSQSCDDITNCDAKLVTPDGESFYSCTDMTESDTLAADYDSNPLLSVTKSHSCDDILKDSDHIFIDNGIKNEELAQHRKEVRKAKVKSLSSSHDALSLFAHMEHLDIDTDSDIKEPRKIANELTEMNSNDMNKHSVSSVEIIKGELSDKEEKSSNVNICDKTKTRNCESDSNKNTFDKGTTKEQSILNNFGKGTKTKVVEQSTNSCLVKNRERSFSEKANKLQTLSTKPPLPRKSNRKVLSVNDITAHCDTCGTNIPSANKRYSMIEISSKEVTDDNMSMLELNRKQIEGSDKKEKSQRITVKSHSCDFLNSPTSTPKIIKESNTINSASDSKRFLFDEEHIQSYTLKPSDTANNHIPLQKSVSSGNVPKDSFDSQSSSYSSHSLVSLNRLSQSYSDDVFRRLSSLSPPQARSPAPEKLLNLDGFINFDDTNNGFSRFSDLPTSPDVIPDMPGPDMDTVFKYDVCLGYLLHSVQCDNRIVCFYSFQRNKQLMESLITPLAVIPDVLNMGPNNTNHTTTPKQPSKAKSEELPNPAAPITSVPSERLLHAGHVLRTVLLARAPHMIHDRKFHLRTYRRCMVGTEMVDWLMQQCSLVHTRNQAVGMWQGLVEEGVVVHVCHEHQFQDKYLFYRFHEDDEGVSTVPSSSSKRECEEELQEMFLMLAQIGPDAMMRMILRKLPHERTVEDLEIIYEELLHIKALSHLSTMVKRELASVLVFESHAKSGTVLFNQGDEGKSWYIILKGSVNVVIYGKGVVCTLHEGDDFGKLALVNDAPRAATIVLRDDNCHFLRVDKDDFNRILRDVEANTVRLKEHGQDVLVLEKIPSNTQTSDGTVHAHYKYSVMAGTPEKMLEHLLETRLDNKKEDEIDGFLEDFILTHVIFMPCNHLCPVLLSHYHSSGTETTDQEGYEFMYTHKKCVLHFVQEWSNIVGHAFKEDHTINAFLEELHSCVLDDLVSYPSLRDDLVTLETVLQAQTDVAEGKAKKRSGVNFTLSRKPSKDSRHDHHGRKKSIRPTDENIFKVYCADHTYSTLKLSMDTNVENLLLNIKEKLGLGDDLILCEVKSSGERIILKDNDLCVTSGLSINGRLFVTPKEHLDALTPLPEQEGPSEGTFSTIEMFSSREMAYYMTLYDWELFTSVQEYELIYQVFGRYKFQKITANLDLFLRRFNEIQFWIVTEMVLTTQLSKRVALLRKFIKLAAHCKEYQNLNSFFAVVMGLSNIAVSRLSQTWEKLPSKFKKMFVEFETLMDPSRNHRVYRLTVAKMAPPILPFMPLLMKDMTFTHEGNKTYFDGLVNFEKMRMISQTLKTVKFCRKTNIDLEMPGSTKSADAMSYIRNFHVIDNQRLLTQLSHKLEPRKT